MDEQVWTKNMLKKDDSDEHVWEGWQRQRLLVREIKGLYGEAYKGLLDQPRVYSKEWPWKKGRWTPLLGQAGGRVKVEPAVVHYAALLSRSVKYA